ncbi:Peptidase family M50 [candidate division SR1 bacterium Aalborg_AAW-1]|nr:Peptidase family M50 [candidate division SR1 bacterium Aalborg_AAW-1]
MLQNLFTLDTLFLALIFIVSISLHEYAHAWMANRLGDPTPRNQGRLTPNPIAHIDPVGFILIFLIGFGWGRAVQYNPHYLKNPLWDELKIALAGPAMNILLSIGAIIILIIYQLIAGAGQDLVTAFWMQFAFMNIALAVFNMIPIPPLDGYRVIKVFAPRLMTQVEQYGQYIILGFALLFIRGPGSGLLQSYISNVSGLIFGLLYGLLSLPLQFFI